MSLDDGYQIKTYSIDLSISEEPKMYERLGDYLPGSFGPIVLTPDAVLVEDAEQNADSEEEAKPSNIFVNEQVEFDFLDWLDDQRGV